MARCSGWCPRRSASGSPTSLTPCSRSTYHWSSRCRQPHQITAVYEAMLPRQPLRFLLADDPGASKTIMAGLLINELISQGT